MLACEIVNTDLKIYKDIHTLIAVLEANPYLGVIDGEGL
jgi:hypothetical protein